MQGSLTQLPLPEVLQFISMGKSSGILQLRLGAHEISLYIRSGRIINSSSIERRRRLGDLLVNRGLIKRSELARLLNVQRTVESDKRLGQILVERDIVSEDTIRQTLRLQLEEEIWSLFSWTEGEFVFEPVPDDKLGDAIVSIDIEPLILEGTRRNDEWREIQAVIPDDTIVLAVAPLREDFERDLHLREEEWHVLSQVNGRFTVRAIVNRSNMGRFEVHRILSQLIKGGLVVPVAKGKEDDAAQGATQMRRRLEAEGQEKAAGKPAGGAAGLLTKVMGAAGRRSAGGGARGPRSFASPIGLLAEFTNELCARMMEAREYTRQPGDLVLVQRLWQDLVQSYTKADLIQAQGNTLDASALERLFELCEFRDVVDEPYEDGLEGLINLLQATFRVLGQRLGDRNAARIVRELLEDYAASSTVRHRGPFPIAEKVQNVLRLAA